MRGERELIISKQLHCHHQNDFRVKMDSAVKVLIVARDQIVAGDKLGLT